jgi:hypothetical protein
LLRSRASRRLAVTTCDALSQTSGSQPYMTQAC